MKRTDIVNYFNNEINISNEKGMYLHIPFCKYICNYCDFCKKYSKDHDHIQYVDALIKDINHQINKDMWHEGKINIRTIYIGGGTPSALHEEALHKLLQYLNDIITMENVLEFTFECNPDDVTDSLMQLLKGYGINRISMGIQTLNDEVLKAVRRGHNLEHSKKALDTANKYFDNISIDLMFNLPKQTFTDIYETFTFIKERRQQINHISYYSLIIEEHTVIGNSNFENFTEAEEAEIYQLIQTNLEKLGYQQYEISNFAQTDKESLHNITYWFGGEYYGCGLGASGYINSLRTSNTRSMKKYLTDLKENNYDNIIVESETIDEFERKKEIVIFGLRTIWGIPKKIIKVDEISVKTLAYLNIDQERIIIKQEYFFIDNEIILELLDLIV